MWRWLNHIGRYKRVMSVDMTLCAMGVRGAAGQLSILGKINKFAVSKVSKCERIGPTRYK
jgi:hypothetical protein